MRVFLWMPDIISILNALWLIPSVHTMYVWCPMSVMFFLRGNNSALGGHRVLPKVANERYCNIVLIFGVGITGTGTGTSKRFLKKKNVFLVGYQFFFWAHGGGGVRCCVQWGPEGPHRIQHGSPPQGLEVRGP